MTGYKSASRVSLTVSALIFVVYFLDRLSASPRVPIDLYRVPAETMFGLLLIMALFVGASFMIEAHLSE